MYLTLLFIRYYIFSKIIFYIRQTFMVFCMNVRWINIDMDAFLRKGDVD